MQLRLKFLCLSQKNLIKTGAVYCKHTVVNNTIVMSSKLGGRSYRNDLRLSNILKFVWQGSQSDQKIVGGTIIIKSKTKQGTNKHWRRCNHRIKTYEAKTWYNKSIPCKTDEDGIKIESNYYYQEFNF